MKQTKQIFEANGIVALRADKTDLYSSEPVDEMLKELGNETAAIPYFAVFVPGRDAPIHFNPPTGTFLSSEALLDHLKQQGLTLEKESPDAPAGERVARQGQ